jgi:hypothetical protein
MATQSDAAIAMMEMTEGAEMVAVGIPQHLLEHPELDSETREILEAVAIVIPLLSTIARQSFINALNADDALTEVKTFLDTIEP